MPTPVLTTSSPFTIVATTLEFCKLGAVLRFVFIFAVTLSFTSVNSFSSSILISSISSEVVVCFVVDSLSFVSISFVVIYSVSVLGFFVCSSKLVCF